MVFETTMVIDDQPQYSKLIKVIGVGGAGCNAINRMVAVGIKDVDLVATNTDNDSLSRSNATNIIQLGRNVTLGLGAGFHPSVGRESAEASADAIDKVLEAPTKMVFITAGMGGGTGTGAAPYIAARAKEKGILTVAVITFPFTHEGDTKIENAQEGVNSMRESCDAVLIINNQRIFDIYAENGEYTDREAYSRADDVLVNAVKCIAELVTIKGEQNIDFNDVNTTLQNKGQAMMGVGLAEGEDREMKALNMALTSPLLENCDIKGAQNILINYTYSIEKKEYELKVSERVKITNAIKTRIGQSAKMVKDGIVYDNSMGGKLQIKIVAAGFDEKTIVIAPSKPSEPTKPYEYVKVDNHQYIENLIDAYMVKADKMACATFLPKKLFIEPTYIRMNVPLLEAAVVASQPGKVYAL